MYGVVCRLFTFCVHWRIKHIRRCGANFNCGVLVESVYVFHTVQSKKLYIYNTYNTIIELYTAYTICVYSGWRTRNWRTAA